MFFISQDSTPSLILYILYGLRELCWAHIHRLPVMQKQNVVIFAFASESKTIQDKRS